MLTITEAPTPSCFRQLAEVYRSKGHRPGSRGWLKGQAEAFPSKRRDSSRGLQGPVSGQGGVLAHVPESGIQMNLGTFLVQFLYLYKPLQICEYVCA